MMNTLRNRVARLEDAAPPHGDPDAANRYYQLCRHLEVEAPEPLPGELGPEYLARLAMPTIKAMLEHRRAAA